MKAGTVLARLNDTRFRNEYALAGVEKSVADARLKQAALSAFINVEAKKEIAIAKAEKRLHKPVRALPKTNSLKQNLSHRMTVWRFIQTLKIGQGGLSQPERRSLRSLNPHA